jgi:hypothetical protein
MATFGSGTFGGTTTDATEAGPLAALAELADYQRRDLGGVEATAGLALAGASGMVRDYLGWSVSAESTTFTLDGTGTPLLAVPTLRLTDVTEVRLDGVALAAGTWTWSARGHVRRTAGVWPDTFRCVELDCSHGYDPVPDAVKLIVLSVATRAMTNPTEPGLILKTVGAISRRWNRAADDVALTALETAVIDRYRLP